MVSRSAGQRGVECLGLIAGRSGTLQVCQSVPGWASRLMIAASACGPMVAPGRSRRIRLGEATKAPPSRSTRACGRGR